MNKPADIKEAKGDLALLILRMNRYADRFEKIPDKGPHAETIRQWVKHLEPIAALIERLSSAPADERVNNFMERFNAIETEGKGPQLYLSGKRDALEEVIQAFADCFGRQYAQLREVAAAPEIVSSAPAKDECASPREAPQSEYTTRIDLVDGAVDDVAISHVDMFRLEQMSAGHWWMMAYTARGNYRFGLYTPRNSKIICTHEVEPPDPPGHCGKLLPNGTLKP